jgi:hypothetical protein
MLYPSHSLHLLDSLVSDRSGAWISCLHGFLKVAPILLLCFCQVLPFLKQLAREGADLVVIGSFQCLLLGAQLAQLARHRRIMAQRVYSDVISR